MQTKKRNIQKTKGLLFVIGLHNTWGDEIRWHSVADRHIAICHWDRTSEDECLFYGVGVTTHR